MMQSNWTQAAQGLRKRCKDGVWQTMFNPELALEVVFALFMSGSVGGLLQTLKAEVVVEALGISLF